jgi:cell division protein FtsB
MVSERHRTTSIRRPADPTRAAARTGRDDASRFSEFTRPISRDKQLLRGTNRTAVWIVGGLVTVALLASLFVFPVQAWMRQEDDLAARQTQLDELVAANAELASENERLRTEEGVREAAREEIGYVEPGETRVAVVDEPTAPLVLPLGFPYDAMSQIIAVRSATPAPAAAAGQP